MPDSMIERDRELQSAARFLSELQDGLAALVFAGEPGIGKTTLWRKAFDQARASSYLVLSARPVQAEAGLAFAGLADLLEPVAEEVLPELPEPQARALKVALLREDPGSVHVDQRAVSAAARTALAALARRGPVVIAVDDLQWLDRPSARVLGFALRRLTGAPIGVLASERMQHGVRVPLALEEVVPEDRFRRLELGPLSLTALRRLLGDRLRRQFSRRTVAQIEQVTGGNPFFALEVARSLPDGALPSAAGVTIPDRLVDLVEARILALPRRSRRALLAASCLVAPTVEAATAAAGGTAAESERALAHAESLEIIEIDGPALRFTHPLFAAAVYTMAPAVERRRMHRRLAGLTKEIEERARHRALGADRADAELAALLDTAAEHARTRGAPDSAADLIEWARALTPADCVVQIHRRTVRAAEYLFHAGELRRAREMIEDLLGRGPADPELADALRLLGEIHCHEDSFDEAIQAFRQALEHVGENRELRLAIEVGLAFARVSKADFVGASDHAVRALAVAKLGTEPTSAAQAFAVAAMADFLAGRGLDEAKIQRALDLEDPWHQVPVLVRPSLIAGCLALFEGRLDRCEAFLEPFRDRMVERGEEGDLALTSCYLIWSASWRGELARAESYAIEAIDGAAHIRSDAVRCLALAFAAVASAFAGRPGLTESRARESISLASRTGDSLAVLWARWALGVLALSRDDPAAADASLAPVANMFNKYIPEPIRGFFIPDEIEALVALGELAAAERLLEMFGEAAHRLRRPWALMLQARSRALLLAARGDLDGACEQVGLALDMCAGLETRIEIARTLLVAGQIERRMRRKSLAADHLRRAAALFDQMGALTWAERARAELSRVGLRPPAPAELTVSERRVAELIASGRTNREVAAQLFMSPKTVEAKLARIYRKLGVHSRAQLGTQLMTLQT